MRSRPAGRLPAWFSLALAAAAVGVLLAAGCARTPTRPSGDVFILLPDEHGKTGAIIVSGAGGERRLDKPREALRVEPGKPPGQPFIMPKEQVGALVGPALQALPPPPMQFILYFRSDTTQLTRASMAQVKEMIRAIRERGPVDVSVVGNTDTVGTKKYNYRLALERARTVAALLTAKGVDRSILEIASHGEDNLLVPTGDEVPEPRNRRVEVTVR